MFNPYSLAFVENTLAEKSSEKDGVSTAGTTTSISFSMWAEILLKYNYCHTTPNIIFLKRLLLHALTPAHLLCQTQLHNTTLVVDAANTLDV